MPPSKIGYLPASAVLDFIHPGARILVPAEAAEPATLLDAIDAAGPTLQDVQILTGWIRSPPALFNRGHIRGGLPT